MARFARCGVFEDMNAPTSHEPLFPPERVERILPTRIVPARIVWRALLFGQRFGFSDRQHDRKREPVRFSGCVQP